LHPSAGILFLVVDAPHRVLYIARLLEDQNVVIDGRHEVVGVAGIAGFKLEAVER
jgi:hypothetical protein